MCEAPTLAPREATNDYMALGIHTRPSHVHRLLFGALLANVALSNNSKL